MRGYQRLRGCLLALAAALAALLAAVPATVALASGSTGTIDAVSVEEGRVSFLLGADLEAGGPGLDPSTVTVTVDGRRLSAEATPVAHAPRRAQRTAVVAVDTSGSMSGSKIDAARAAARAFIAAVPADVEVALISFADRPRVVVPPTGDRARLERAVARLTPGGDTSLYDAVTLALRTLDDAGGQRMLVVLSDGADTVSRGSLAGASRDLRNADVTPRFVSLASSASDAGESDISGLRTLAESGGGRVVTAADGAQLAAVFRAAAQTFAQQVSVTATVPDDLAGRQGVLRVEARSGSQRVVASRQVVFAGSLSARRDTASGDTTPRVVVRTPAMYAALGLFFAGASGLLLVLMAPSLFRSRRRERVAEIDRYSLTTQSQLPGNAEEHGAVARTALELAGRAVAKRGLEDKIALRLDRAAMSLRPHEWVLLRACVCLGLSAGLVVLFGNVVLGVLLGVLVGWLATHVYVAFRAHRRLAAFRDGLPDTLQLVAGSLKSGFSLPQALDAAAREGQPPVSSELGRALASARLGMPVEDALDEVADRMDSVDFRWTVMAIRIQREVGGNLAEVLETTVKTMRDRASLFRHVRALSAEGRLSAYVLIALPILLAVYLLLTKREYISVLWTTGPGIAMGVGAVLLVIAGWFWMRKLVRVEV